jgi:hypothetical protein
MTAPPSQGFADRPAGAPVPEQYHDLLNSLDPPPDRPIPLTRFEYAVPDEATLTAQMARLAARLVVENYCAMKSANPSTPAMRDQHAKTHGCVEAELIVRSDLPDEFATPLFRPGARYPAIVRFSNGQGKPQSDKKMDARGMSIKLRDVDAPTILYTLSPDKTRAREHDFALSTFPVFFCKNVVDYSQFMDLVTETKRSATWRDRFRLLPRWSAFIVRNPRVLFLFFRTGIEGMLKSHNPLIITYHSMSPFLFGEDKVVRYVVSPIGRSGAADTWWNYLSPKSDARLQEALVRDLDPARPGHDVAFDVSVRVRHSPTAEDAEDASRWWTSPQDRVVQLGTIAIPKQTFLSPEQIYDGERMTFNPWNCVPQHQPVGSVNRMRLAVYLASQQVRRTLNMVAS